MPTNIHRNPVVAYLFRLWNIVSFRRISGLSAEAAFWIIFSLPWLAFGAVNVIGLMDNLLSASTMSNLQAQLTNYASRFLTPEVVTTYVQPLLDQVFSDGSTSISILSFVIALWSGSRGIQTFIEANMIINGQFRTRSFVGLKLISISIMVALAVMIALGSSLVALGPSVLAEFIDVPTRLMHWLVIVTILVLGILVITALLHTSLTIRPSLISSLPGAIFTLVGWGVGGVYLSFYARRLFDDASVYGVLAAPIAVMLYAYVMSLVVFIGSAINAAGRGIDAGPRAVRHKRPGTDLSRQKPMPSEMVITLIDKISTRLPSKQAHTKAAEAASTSASANTGEFDSQAIPAAPSSAQDGQSSNSGSTPTTEVTSKRA